MADKFAPYLPRLDEFLEEANYESVPEAGPQLISAAAGLVRDPDDASILASILMSKPDVALTGDKDLLTDEIRAIAPTCTCAEYLQRRETR
jgi:predicted nucleic acid-binding protein